MKRCIEYVSLMAQKTNTMGNEMQTKKEKVIYDAFKIKFGEHLMCWHFKDLSVRFDDKGEFYYYKGQCYLHVHPAVVSYESKDNVFKTTSKQDYSLIE